MAQFFHMHPQTPQIRLLTQAAAMLRNGSVIVYPTDSGYALGCLLGDLNALERIRKIRQLDTKHNFTLVCNNLSEVALFARVDNRTFRFLKNNTPGPYTFILPGTKEVPRRVLTQKRKTIGIRIPTNKICIALLEALGEPLMSTTLILPDATDAEFDPEQIEQKIGKKVDLVIHGGYLDPRPTTVVDLTEDDPKILRVGVGDPKPFIY